MILLEGLCIFLLEELLLGLYLELLFCQVLVGLLGLAQELLKLGAQLLEKLLVLEDDEVLLDLYQLVCRLLLGLLQIFRETEHVRLVLRGVTEVLLLPSEVGRL